MLRGEKSRFQLFGDTVNTGRSNNVQWTNLHLEKLSPNAHHGFVQFQLREWNRQVFLGEFNVANRKLPPMSSVCYSALF